MDPLEAHINESISVSQRHGYHPTEFIRMCNQYRSLPDVITRLVTSGDIQSGFKRLEKLGLLDWSIETAVLKFPNYFSAETQACARFRLEEAARSGKRP